MTTIRSVLVTGAAGFVGSHFVDTMLAAGHPVVSVDRLAYAADMLHLEGALANPRHTFIECGVEDSARMTEIRREHAPVSFADGVSRTVDWYRTREVLLPVADATCQTEAVR